MVVIAVSLIEWETVKTCENDARYNAKSKTETNKHRQRVLVMESINMNDYNSQYIWSHNQQ